MRRELLVLKFLVFATAAIQRPGKRSPFVPRRRRSSRDAGKDGVHFPPIHAGGALGDGGAVQGVVEWHAERAGDGVVHGDVLAGGEFAGLRGEAVGQVDVECHGRGMMAAKSRGSKTSTPSARTGARWRRWCVTMRRAAESQAELDERFIVRVIEDGKPAGGSEGVEEVVRRAVTRALLPAAAACGQECPRDRAASRPPPATF